MQVKSVRQNLIIFVGGHIFIKKISSERYLMSPDINLLFEWKEILVRMEMTGLYRVSFWLVIDYS